MTARTLAAVAAGGVLGALARYGISAAWDSVWAVWAVNVTGCFLIGALMVVIDRRPVSALLRPFVGVGVLGGYTTFSTAMVDVQRGAGLLYLGATLVAALVAVWLGTLLAEAVARPR